MAEPITLAEAKTYMRIDPDYDFDDSVIDIIITAQREAMEAQLELSLVEKTGLKYKYQRKCCSQSSLVNLPFGPVTGTPVFKDWDNVTIDPAPENVGSDDFPAYYFKGSTNVTYNAGYTAENIPSDLKLALLMRVATAYENRENSTTETNNEVTNNSRQLERPHSRNVF